MDTTQWQFVKILSDSLKNEQSSIDKDIDYDKILELGKEHNVDGILYHRLISNDIYEYIPKEKRDYLKKKIYRIKNEQTKFIYDATNIFKKFNQNNIKFILLGEVAVRNLYRFSEQRESTEINILVNNDDIDNIKNALLELNYRVTKNSEDKNIIRFINKNNRVVDVFFHIYNNELYTNHIKIYEKNVWKKAIKINIGDLEPLSLYYDDLLILICRNIADDIRGGNFELRKLCDFTLIVYKKNNEINWDSFIMKARMYGVEKFSSIMFILCNELFNIDVPEEIDTKKINSKKYINALLNEIFAINEEEINEVAIDIGDIKEKFKFDIREIGEIIKELIKKIKLIIDKFVVHRNKERLFEWMEI